MSNYEPYQQRVVDEKTELDEKIKKLNVFVNSETYSGICTKEQDRLLKQKEIMSNYSDILNNRIINFLPV